ncbi:MAG TPA: HAMP domain-containing protein, partial [Fibrobacteria bacterium]|nr:HAMP domain-containing protein [Fibrobacteria bacterium]
MTFLSRHLSHLKFGLVWQFAIAFTTMTLVAGAFLYLAVRNYAENNIQTSSQALMVNGRAAVFSRMGADLALAEHVVMGNAALARHGKLPLHDEQRLTRFFLEQVKQKPTIDYLFFANEQGGIASGGTQFGEFRLIYTPGMTLSLRVVERVDASGRFLARRPPPRIADYDPRERPWYVATKQKRRLTWYQAHFGTVAPDLSLAVSYPLVDSAGDFQGVFGGNVMLDSLGSYLEAHRSSPNAHLMLLEPNGDLIANSSGAPLISVRNGVPRRLKAESVPKPLSREVAGLIDKVHASRAPSFGTYLKDDQGRAYYLDIAPFSRGPDIRWYLVTVVPRSDFTGPLDALWARFLAILLGGAAGAAALSLVMAGWVTRPMRAINEQVQRIAAGRFGSRVETRRRDEIGQLAHSFNDMSTRLAGTYEEIQLSYAALDASNRDLATLLERERVSRMEVEAEGRRAHLLGEATAAMSETQDYDRVLWALPRALVHAYVDWAVVEIAAPDGETRTAGAHRDADQEPLLR